MFYEESRSSINSLIVSADGIRLSTDTIRLSASRIRLSIHTIRPFTDTLPLRQQEYISDKRRHTATQNVL